MAAEELQEVESLVKRQPWEPRHEWESRVKFVEDNTDTHGVQKATNLSLVWANMKFLGCSYPTKTEALVAHYPMPDMDTLRDRRKRRKSEQSASDTSNVDAASGDESSAAKKSKLGEDSTDSEKPCDPTIASQVDALIAAVRKQHESQGTDKTLEMSIPPILKTISKHVCICEACLGQLEPPTPLQKLNTVLQRYTTGHDRSLVYEFIGNFAHLPDGNKGTQSILMINEEVVAEKSSLKKKEAKLALAEHVLEILAQCQEKYGKPSCPKGRPSSSPSHKYGRSYSDDNSKTSPSYARSDGIRSSFFSSAVQKATRK